MNADDAILQRLRRVAVASLNLGLAESELATLTRLDAVTGVDSLTVLELVAGIEAEFGITLAPDELKVDLITDLPRLAAHLAQRRAAGC